MLDGLAGGLLGDGARMDEGERRLIEDPLARVMARMAPGTNAVLERWLDPILLFYAFSSWGRRVYVDLARLAGDDDSGPGDDLDPVTPTRSPNGHEAVPTGSPPVHIMDEMASQSIVVEGIDELETTETPGT